MHQRYETRGAVGMCSKHLYGNTFCDILWIQAFSSKIIEICYFHLFRSQLAMVFFSIFSEYVNNLFYLICDGSEKNYASWEKISLLSHKLRYSYTSLTVPCKDFYDRLWIYVRPPRKMDLTFVETLIPIARHNQVRCQEFFRAGELSIN